MIVIATYSSALEQERFKPAYPSTEHSPRPAFINRLVRHDNSNMNGNKDFRFP